MNNLQRKKIDNNIINPGEYIKLSERVRRKVKKKKTEWKEKQKEI